MTPHKSHRRPRRDGNTKTMHELVADIMEMENSNDVRSNVRRSSATANVMSERNSAEYRIPKWRLNQAEGARRSRKGTVDTRKRKDDHNIIERRRRNNINTLIKELRSLLPNLTDTSKGSTLKAAVDYLRDVKRDRERLRTLEAAAKKQEQQAKSTLHVAPCGDKNSVSSPSTPSTRRLPDIIIPVMTANQFSPQETEFAAVKDECGQFPIISAMRTLEDDYSVSSEYPNISLGYDMNAVFASALPAETDQSYPELSEAMMFFEFDNMDELSLVQLE